MNCLFWNMYRDFGVGQMGDMGAHTMDLLWNSIDAGAPTAIEVDQEVSDKFNPDITPVKLKATFEHPANQWRGPVTVVWYQGGLKPNAPKGYIDVQKIPNGAIFEGTKGSHPGRFHHARHHSEQRRRRLHLLQAAVAGRSAAADRRHRADHPGTAAPGGVRAAWRRGGAQCASADCPPASRPCRTRSRRPTDFPWCSSTMAGVPADLGMPNTDVAPVLEAEKAGRGPNLGGSLFQMEWIDACKGKNGSVAHGTSSKTHCDFDYSGSMMEQMLLGLVAHRAGKRLEYDPATGRVTNDSAANEWLKRGYRAGWTLNG